jgi:hypothetical protein
MKYAARKATKAAFAVCCVLHNRRVCTAVRRIVLLAVVRPILEYASTVCLGWSWHWVGAAGAGANAGAEAGAACAGHCSYCS